MSWLSKALKKIKPGKIIINALKKVPGPIGVIASGAETGFNAVKGAVTTVKSSEATSTSRVPTVGAYDTRSATVGSYFSPVQSVFDLVSSTAKAGENFLASFL